MPEDQYQISIPLS